MDLGVLGGISASLEGLGYDVDRFRSGSELLIALRRDTYDVVVVDQDFPPVGGLTIMRRCAEFLEQPPAFIITTSGIDTANELLALDQGASDYIVKPQDAEVIIARIEAAARRRGASDRQERFREFGPYRIDKRNGEIRRHGQPVRMTAKEFRVASLFFDNLERPLSRAYIFSQIWGTQGNLETRTLDMHVSRVRSKLELRPENGFAIQTVFGFGYRMDTFSRDGEDGGADA